MKKRTRTCIARICLICMILSGCIFPASAEDAYTAFPVYLDGLLTSRGYEINGTDYIALSTFSRLLDAPAEAVRDEENRTYTIRILDVEMTAADNVGYLRANGRYLFIPDGVKQINGGIYLPADIFSRVLNLSVSYSDSGRKRMYIDSTSMKTLMDGESYYSTFYTQEDLHWLSRIIYSEAANHSLAGQIGVGNVVFNRMFSEKYPDTIKGVVFDTNNGYQFEPVMSGTIYEEPNELAYIAAYLCFEGYNLVGDSLFFVEPLSCDDSWFRRALTYVTSIDTHDFYA